MGQCAATDGTHGPSSDGTSGGEPPKRTCAARTPTRDRRDFPFGDTRICSNRGGAAPGRERSALFFEQFSLFESERKTKQSLTFSGAVPPRPPFVCVCFCVSSEVSKRERERVKDLVNNAWFLTPTGHADNQTKRQRQKQRDNRAAPLGCNKYSRVASGRFFVDELFKSFARIGTIIQWGNYMDVEFHRVMETLIFKFVRPTIGRYFYHISLFSLLKQNIFQNFSR